MSERCKVLEHVLDTPAVCIHVLRGTGKGTFFQELLHGHLPVNTRLVIMVNSLLLQKSYSLLSSHRHGRHTEVQCLSGIDDLKHIMRVRIRFPNDPLLVIMEDVWNDQTWSLAMNEYWLRILPVLCVNDVIFLHVTSGDVQLPSSVAMHVDASVNFSDSKHATARAVNINTGYTSDMTMWGLVSVSNRDGHAPITQSIYIPEIARKRYHTTTLMSSIRQALSSSSCALM